MLRTGAFMLLDLKDIADAPKGGPHCKPELRRGGGDVGAVRSRTCCLGAVLPTRCRSPSSTSGTRASHRAYHAAAVDSSAVKGKGMRWAARAVDTAPPAEASMAGQARNLLLWHKHHAFCGVCGGAAASGKGGWKRECGSCGAQLFPRTDPVIISAVLSPDGERLLGRQAKSPRGSSAASPASSTRARRSRRPCGARCTRRRASSSARRTSTTTRASRGQTAPRGQLMLGFLSVAESEGLAVDTAELETAQWVALDEVRAALAGGVTTAGGGGTGGGVGVDAGGLLLPVPSAIANQLLHAACDVHAVMSGQGGGGAGA